MQTHAHTDIPNDLFFFLTKIDILENIAEGIKRLFHLGKHLYRSRPFIFCPTNHTDKRLKTSGQTLTAPPPRPDDLEMGLNDLESFQTI